MDIESCFLKREKAASPLLFTVVLCGFSRPWVSVCKYHHRKKMCSSSEIAEEVLATTVFCVWSHRLMVVVRGIAFFPLTKQCVALN